MCLWILLKYYTFLLRQKIVITLRVSCFPPHHTEQNYTLLFSVVQSHKYSTQVIHKKEWSEIYSDLPNKHQSVLDTNFSKSGIGSYFLLNCIGNERNIFNIYRYTRLQVDARVLVKLYLEKPVFSTESKEQH